MENHPEEQEPEPEPKVRWHFISFLESLTISIFYYEFQSLMIYGRNVAEIPCFRNSFLYGGGAYFAGGLGTFLLTSRPSFSSHIGMTAFVCTTIGFWFHCR